MSERHIVPYLQVMAFIHDVLFYCQYSSSFKISKKCYKSVRAAREKETMTAVIHHSG